jgi:FkbM family methyltransferase
VSVLAALRHRRLQRRLAAPRLLRAFADAYPEARFVEIGSNDGVQHDHLRPFVLSHRWRGVMVEPQPHVFTRLERNYGNVPGVSLERAAVTGRDGSVPFFYPAPPAEDEREALPDWYDGIGSLSRDFVLSHSEHIPGLERRVVRDEVRSLTYGSLCARHDLDRVDLLVLDTEGSDWEILRDIDFGGRPPRLLIYEHFHLVPADRAACRAHAESLGYETMEEGFDTFCLDAAPDDALTRTWRRLRPAVAGVSVHDEPAP